MRGVLQRGWYALAPATVALLLGLWGLGKPGPWLDERFTIEALTSGLSQHLWEGPLLPYYGVMWMWSGGGNVTDVVWLRLLSVLAIAAAAALVSLTARRLSNVPAGLAAGMLLALAPGVSRYAQEARVYAIATALVAFATLALVLAMTGAPRRWWVGYGLALGVAGVLLPLSLAVIPVHAVVVTGFENWRERAKDFITACLAIVPVAAAAVLAGFMWPNLHWWLAAPEWGDLSQAVTMIGNSEYTGALGTAYALVLIVLGVLTRTGLRWVAGLSVALLAAFVLSLTFGNWWLPRSFLPLSGVLCVAAGLALASVGWGRVVASLSVLAVASLPAHLAVRQPDSRGEDPRAIAQVMDANGVTGDAVRVPPAGSLAWWTVTYLLRGDPRFSQVAEPVVSRYWEMGETPTCTTYREWSISGGGRLRLCE